MYCYILSSYRNKMSRHWRLFQLSYKFVQSDIPHDSSKTLEKITVLTRQHLKNLTHSNRSAGNTNSRTAIKHKRGRAIGKNSRVAA